MSSAEKIVYSSYTKKQALRERPLSKGFF